MKKLILVAAPPASGKTYVSEAVAHRIPQAVYLDKDDLGTLIEAAFSASGEPYDMDGEFYRASLRPAEYTTLMGIAFSTLRFADYVIVNAPFGKEVRDCEVFNAWKERANACGAELILIWVNTPRELCYERMKARDAIRDRKKLLDFERYSSTINYTPPFELLEGGCVDHLLLFESENEMSFQKSMKLILDVILKG